jgi:3-polyprenyl-4-hydroxybenzoate decarboxylase
MSDVDNVEGAAKAGEEIRREVITVRHTTTTREAIRITVSQRIADNGELALATATITGHMPSYYEKPDLMEDLAMALINSAYIARKFNKHVIGKR